MQSTMSLLAKPHCSAKTKRLLLSSSSRRIVVALLVVCSICLGSPMTLAFHVPIGMNVNNNKRVAVGGPSSDDTFQSCRHYFPSLHINNKNRDLLLRGRALFLATDLFFATIEDSINTQGLDEQLIDEQEGDDDDDPSIGTIQILMSDTGGGHRASANALRDAFNFLYPPDNQSSTNGGSSPGKRIACDIVDIYTEYGPVWPYNDYVALYKFMAAYPWIWQAFYEFGSTDFGLWLNDILLEFFCFDAFAACLNRPSAAAAASTAESLSSKRQRRQRADMVVSVHPLTQELPLKILATLDHPSNDYSFKQRMPKTSRQTPFCTVVTDLGSAHPTWFNPG